MKSTLLKSHFFLPSLTNPTANPSVFILPIKTKSCLKPTHTSITTKFSRQQAMENHEKGCYKDKFLISESSKREFLQVFPDEYSQVLLVGAVSVGFVLFFFMGVDDQKALALGPDGPLVEEFWENVRRYALYALTVSTGALYTIFQPIFELLKNPISAILLLVIFGGSIYIVSQVLSAMVGVTEFAYDYGY
ncbi:Peroxiredoxin Q, chloroplastic [Melia azedarach]|uniref:Peroxiredoxin Q, chloroplastic n=1 Tax=Melia azedarach TaxID=155640 RepID=A0ACC1WYW6_MELAZ|nr:Peroxiredoxin Q, chloroplastic [Melia azedarach]